MCVKQPKQNRPGPFPTDVLARPKPKGMRVLDVDVVEEAWVDWPEDKTPKGEPAR